MSSLPFSNELTSGKGAPESLHSSTLTIDKKGPTVDVKPIRTDLVEAEDQQFKLINVLFRRRLLKPIDLNAVATKRSVYDDPDLAPHYWPKSDYENLHRFDPSVRWTYGEEKVT